MPQSTIIKSAQELPLLMSAKDLQSMGLPRSLAYNMMNVEGFPILKIGNRKLVPKDKFIKWILYITSTDTDTTNLLL